MVQESLWNTKYCPWSQLLINIYIRELGKLISNCAHGVKYAVTGKDGIMECKNQAGFLYADECVFDGE